MGSGKMLWRLLICRHACQHTFPCSQIHKGTPVNVGECVLRRVDLGSILVYPNDTPGIHCFDLTRRACICVNTQSYLQRSVQSETLPLHIIPNFRSVLSVISYRDGWCLTRFRCTVDTTDAWAPQTRLVVLTYVPYALAFNGQAFLLLQYHQSQLEEPRLSVIV